MQKLENKGVYKSFLDHNRLTQYNQYRIIKHASLVDLAKLPSQLENFSKSKKEKTNSDDYYCSMFEPCNRITTEEIEEKNQGVNT